MEFFAKKVGNGRGINHFNKRSRLHENLNSKSYLSCPSIIRFALSCAIERARLCQFTADFRPTERRHLPYFDGHGAKSVERQRAAVATDNASLSPYWGQKKKTPPSFGQKKELSKTSRSRLPFSVSGVGTPIEMTAGNSLWRTLDGCEGPQYFSWLRFKKTLRKLTSTQHFGAMPPVICGVSLPTTHTHICGAGLSVCSKKVKGRAGSSERGMSIFHSFFLQGKWQLII